MGAEDLHARSASFGNLVWGVIEMKALVLGAALVGAMVFAGAASAADESGTRVGTLTCSEAPGWGYILGSNHKMHCIFTTGDNRVERYDGDISRVGIDLGYQQSATVVWEVIAPTSRVRRGDLAGHFGGASANATFGVGLGANVLVGGFDKSFMLQPISVEGLTGLNAAVGIAGLTLTSRPVQHARR
jgi:hypothetical protein